MTRPLTLILGCTVLAACGTKDKAEPTAPATHAHEAQAGSAPATPPDAGHGAHSAHAPLEGYAAVAVDSTRRQLLGIKTAPVTHQRIDQPIRTVGIVQSDETRTTHVHVKFEGFIEKLYVNYTGRLVRKGQPLFSIFSRDLLAAQQEYLSSRNALAKMSSATSDSVRSSAQQLADASRERLRLFDVPPAVLADIERTGVAQRSITIVSPQSGTVIEKQAIEGLAVTPMMHLYVIADLSRVWVLADVYERDMSRVKVGQHARLAMDSLPGRTFEGTVTFVSPTIDPATRTIKVRFEFPNREGALRPGAYATVELATPGEHGLTIGADSVIDTGERKVVFVEVGEGRFEPRAIVVGAAFGDRYQVVEGLHEGEKVATSGQFLLDSESRLRGARAGGGPAHGGH